MYCKISDLIVEIPEVGDLVPRCKEYIIDKQGKNADIILNAEKFNLDRWKNLSENDAIYLESARCFYSELLKYDGMMLHASAIEWEGKAYLFSGYCGAGKSTHTRLWQETFGISARVFNDDKPALRLVGDQWYAYGTPWCGKNSININMKVPLAGICFMKQSEENRIERLSHKDAVQRIVFQTIRRLDEKNSMQLMLSHLDKLITKIPIFELENRPESEAVYLSYITMRRAAEEAGL